MIKETKNYIKYRTLCPVPQECLQQSGSITQWDVVSHSKEKLQMATALGEVTLEKKQAIGELVNVLKNISQKQEQQYGEFVNMLRNLNGTKQNETTADNSGLYVKKINEETAEEKLKKAEKRVQELEILLKKMEKEKEQHHTKAEAVEKNNTVKKADTKKTELLNRVLKSTQEITVNAQVQRENQAKIAALKQPHIEKKGVMFKKITVTWSTIYFGSYPQIKETLLKTG